GEVDGRRYVSRATVDEAASEQSYTEDQMLGLVRRGLFFALDAKEFPAATPTTIHWGGYGGSWLTMDPAAGITCAYTPNRWLDGDPWLIRQAEQWQVLTDLLRRLAWSACSPRREELARQRLVRGTRVRAVGRAA